MGNKNSGGWKPNIWNKNSDSFLVLLWNQGFSTELIRGKLLEKFGIKVSRSMLHGKIYRLRKRGMSMLPRDYKGRQRQKAVGAVIDYFELEDNKFLENLVMAVEAEQQDVGADFGLAGNKLGLFSGDFAGYNLNLSQNQKE